ncbi:hypothetical protein NFI96_030759 [Prochilodus magdalenae]|nr:hypothetical protein NFI96_030759 [Prochilodus magdalenae]
MPLTMAKRETGSTSPVVRQIDKQFLVCSICLEHYHNPKVLPCLHTFCERESHQCLQNSVVDVTEIIPSGGEGNQALLSFSTASGSGHHRGEEVVEFPFSAFSPVPAFCRCLQNYIPPQSLTLSCPVCRQTSILPEKGVAALQNNFFITNLMEVLQRESECSQPEACNVLESASAATSAQPLSCPNHEGKVMEFYCESCETAMCLECTEGEHREHVTVPLRDVLEQHKAVLKNQLDAIQNSPSSVGTGRCPPQDTAPQDAAPQDAAPQDAAPQDAAPQDTAPQDTAPQDTAPQDTAPQDAAPQDSVDWMVQQLPQLTAAIDLVNDITRQLAERKSDAITEISSTFDELERALHQRKNTLITDLENICSTKQKVLQAQLAALLQGKENILSSCSFTEQALSHGSATEVLLVQKQMGERMGALERHPFPEQPHENGHLQCQVETEGLRRSIQNLGVLLTTSAVGHTSVATGEGLRHAVVGQPTTVTVTTKVAFDVGEEVACDVGEEVACDVGEEVTCNAGEEVTCDVGEEVACDVGEEVTCDVGEEAACDVGEEDKAGELVKTGNAALKAQIAGPDGTVTVAEVTDNKNGTYDVGYTLRSEGEFSFSLLLYGQPVRGSPFRLRAVKPCDAPQSPDDVKRRVKSPGGGGGGGHVRQKAVRRPSSMYSTTKKKENPIEDELIYRVGTRGRERGEFSNLQGISTSSNGRIVVADSNNQCIQVFSNDGQFKLRFGVRGRSPGQLQRPTGVTVDMNGDIIVADYDNRWITIFSSDGKFKSKIGAGRLMGPKGVAVDKNGHIIAADNKACCVFIFQSNGKLVTKFGAKGTSDRQFSDKSAPNTPTEPKLSKSGPAFSPHFVAVNNKNEIIVTDFHNHSVKVYNADGEFLFKFGSHGEGNGQFNAPTGVAVDTNGNIIVADWGNSRIQVFDCSGSFLSYINTTADPLYGPQGLSLTSDGHVAVADSGNHCFKVYRYLQ